ncbi:MAG: SagB/ThcOx family dehydrogenase [Oscillospiraceae bacterium]|nr:SagB/ThcOx family dehydrogenase [Oscillospiraceae bacterium]
MKKSFSSLIMAGLILFAACSPKPDTSENSSTEGDIHILTNESESIPDNENTSTESAIIQLPPPILYGEMSLEQTLYERRSHRNFAETTLTKEQLSQLLWAAYGISEQTQNLRTAPSAGALYPLEIYSIIGEVSGISAGVYRYNPLEHQLIKVVSGDVRSELRSSTFGNQQMVEIAPLTIFYTTVFERSTARYGERGIMYTHMEVGHSAQNVYLQATALGLGTCAIGAFHEDIVSELLQLSENETPLYLLPVGNLE